MPGVKREKDGAVAILTLDEPATLNAMTPDLLEDLARAVGEMERDEAVRVLVLTGAGRGFCSGQNLKAFGALGDDIVAGVMTRYFPAMKALRECRVPVVVAVNGVAAGGGFSLAMAGDIIVAARQATFIQVFSRIALVPDLGSTWLLPRLIGRQRALELMLLKEPLKAEQAKAWGLVREVFDDGELRAGALQLARRLADGPTRALVESHAPLAAGSDWPSVVPSMDPWAGIEAMVTRSDPYANGAAKLWPEEAISLADALRIYTQGGAAALRREGETGTIAVGRSADFIVLDRNLFKVAPTAISDVRVDLTVFQGREVYRRH